MSDRIDVTATIRATDLASGAIQSINRSLAGLTRTAASVGNAFRHISHMGSFGGLGHNIQHLGGALSHVGHTLHEVLEPLAAIAGIAGGFSVSESLESYIGDAEHLEHMSKTLGTTADNLGAYEFAARKAGVETEAFDKSMSLATINMRKGAFGLDKNMVGLFGKMGISLKDLKNGTKSAMDYLPQLSQAMQAQTTAQARMAIARAVFGRGGAAMIPFLLQGSEAIKEQTEAYKAQDHITAESAKAAEEFGHKQKDLAQVFKSLRDAVGNAVTPTLTKALENFMDLLQENRVKIVEELTGAFQAMAEGLRDFKWQEFFDGIKETIDWIKAAVHFVGGWRNAMIGVAILLNGPIIAAFVHLGIEVSKLAIIFGQVLVRGIAGASRALIGITTFIGRTMITGIAGASRALSGLAVLLSRGLVTALLAAGRAVLAFGAMLLTTPLGWILAAVAAIAFAAYEIYENWDTIGPWFWRQWDTVKRAFIAAWDWIKSWIPAFVPAAIMAAWETLGSWFSAIWSTVQDEFTAAKTWLAQWIPAGFVPDAIQAVWQTLGSWFSTAWEGVKSAFNAATTWLAGWVPQFVPDALKAVWGAIGEVFQVYWDAVKAVFHGVSTFFTQWLPAFLPDGIKQAWDGLSGWFDQKWADIFGVFQRWAAKLTAVLQPVADVWHAIGGAGSWVANQVGLGGGPAAGAPAPGAPAPGAILATPSGAPGAPGAQGKVDVNVTLGGAVPPNTTVSTRAAGSVVPDVGVTAPAAP